MRIKLNNFQIYVYFDCLLAPFGWFDLLIDQIPSGPVTNTARLYLTPRTGAEP
jgi:hypothetical protein